MSSPLRNKVKVKINDKANTVTLKLERRDTYGRIEERMTFTISRRTFERALAQATIEAPWADLVKKLR